MRKPLMIACGVALAGVGIVIPMGASSAPQGSTLGPDAKTMSLAEFSAERPRSPLRLLFIHHSVGGRWLADAGAKEATGNEIWRSHPEGGGLRSALELQGYQVHEVSYGSELGEKTDDADWLPKFRDQMDALLDGKQNRIVMFKSCFPNNLLDDEAALKRAQASYAALLPMFAAHPDVLFLRVTTPPLAPKLPNEPAWKVLARLVLGKPQPGPRLVRSGPLARKLDQWAVSPDGWLKDYPQKNVTVFDLYGILTDGSSDYLAFPTGGGEDSHPSRAGNERATAQLVPFLNRAVRRAGLSP